MMVYRKQENRQENIKLQSRVVLVCEVNKYARAAVC